MNTEQLYLNQTYLTEFEATVIRSFQREQYFAVVLDKTAFYPTSGGQMHDTGKMDEIDVIDVIEENNEILHLLESPIKDALVKCQINWERRFDFMQQHTAFHTLAQSFLQILEAETLSSHLGEKISTIDVNIDKINHEQIKAVESLANQICFEDRTVKHFFISPEEIDKFDLRAQPSKNQQIRLVEIAAANSLSDLYVMGAKPITALNIIGFPAKIDLTYLERIVQGGSETVKQAGAVILGGHTIKDEELKYGLAVTGIIHPDKLLTNENAKPGDLLILIKPIGTGVISTALKAEIASEEAVMKINDTMKLILFRHTLE